MYGLGVLWEADAGVSGRVVASPFTEMLHLVLVLNVLGELRMYLQIELFHLLTNDILASNAYTVYCTVGS